MSLPPGTRLGPYEIMSRLGGGGMGEVFSARDTRLDRTVALKTLRADVAASADLRVRFEREARAIASITHPHICTLYDVGRARLAGDVRAGEDVDFLVMELLAGETLADRLARGPLTLPETLTSAMQIADALARAHRQGIVHRDLKPSNIMLTQTGVKLLDFGLAQLRRDTDGVIAGATQTAALTGQGTIVGTLQYIAPEQLEGREVDGRADLFAFGAILYEMISGRRAFDAQSQAALVSAVLHSDPPPLTTLDPLLPRSLERVVTGCLAKNPDDRWNSAHDVRLMLKTVVEEPVVGSDPVDRRRSRRREWVAWSLAAVATVAAAVLLGTRVLPRSDASLRVLSILPPDAAALNAGETPGISPDGRHVALVAMDRTGRVGLYVRDLDDRDALSARLLAGTDDATMPFWSPDSRSLAFFARGSLRRVAASGGAVQTLASAPVPRGGSWGRDGIIIFVPHPVHGTLQIPAEGGAASPVPVADGVTEGRWFPAFLPDSRHFIYLAIGPNRIGSMLRVASIDSTEIKDLVVSKSSGFYVEPGYLMFRRGTSLVAQPFDVRRLELEGTALTVVDKIGFNPITYQTPFSASTAGVLAYLADAPAGQLVWFDSLGRRLNTASAPGDFNSLCISADGKRVVFDATDSETGAVDIWSMDLPGGTPKRLTHDPAVDFYVACAPSGDDVVFSSLRRGLPSLYRLKTSRPGDETPMLQTTAALIPTDWSADGLWIVYSTSGATTGGDLWLVPRDGGEPTPFSVTDADERNGRLSPDGRWMAYTSSTDTVGGSEIFVKSFPATGTRTRWQVSSGGGRQPVWHPGGRALFYVSPDQKIVSSEVDGSGKVFVAGTSRTFADIRVAIWDRANQGSAFAITPAGDRLLVSSATEVTRPITIVLNWPAMLGTK